MFLIPNVVSLTLIILNFLYPLPSGKPFSRVIYAEDSTLLSSYLSPDDKWRLMTKTNDVAPELPTAIISKEDKYFYSHPGINPVSIARALFSNVFKLKRVSGASTITMQLARMLEPKERTYSNKLFQMFRAIQLEWHFSKDQILSRYLSYIPMGGNIEGVKAASYLYFGRPPAKLSLAQNMLLVILLNNPENLRPDRFPNRAEKERNKWLRIFGKRNLFSKVSIDDALDEQINGKRLNFKILAPHFCRYILNNYNSDIIISSLNPAIQSKCETLLYNHIQRLKPRQVTNGAIVVIDNNTMQIKAYCGSADYYDFANQGQVDGASAFRSPGSALKPFLYALAMDKGLITPKRQLLDVPTNINGYVPENYDNQFHAQVSAAYALVQSLNIPAIRLLNEYGSKDFRNWLANSGNFSWISKNKDALGLSVILGGCEVNLKELTQFYTIFANDGLLRPLVWDHKNLDTKEGKQLISSSASWLIDDILSNNQRPDIPAYLLDQTELPKVAFKTGTSFGRKDGWAIGVTPRYTIGVWVGNFDGRGAPELSGGEMAVPLLFDLFNSIDSKSNKTWFNKPENVQVRKICRYSGLPVGGLCKLQDDDYYIRHLSSREQCTFEKEIFVSKDERIQYCLHCLPNNGWKKKISIVFPAELYLFLSDKNQNLALPPPHNPSCDAVFNDGGPKILYPVEGFDYLIDEDAPTQIMFQAASDASVTEHYWFLDGKYFCNSPAGKRLFASLKKGIHTVTCMDNLGRSTDRKVKVDYL
jgi:penicillin-binding protein 1C